MADPVTIAFETRGFPEVTRAIDTIEQRLIRMESAGTRAAERGYQARAQSARSELRERDQSYRELGRRYETEQAQEVRAAEKSAREKVRVEENAARDIARIREREAQRASQLAEQQTRDAVAARQKLVRAIGNGALAGAGRVLGVAGSMATAAATIGGGFSIADSVQRAVRDQGLAADIAQSGYLPNGEVVANRQKRSSTDILGAARGAATTYGLDTSSALGGLQKFVGISGDLSKGLDLLPKMAQLARATGTSLDDVAEAAGNVSLNLGDLDKDGSETMKVMRGLAAQGKLGAVEMRDLATQIAKLSSGAGQFAGNKTENILKMGVLAQEARGEGGAFSASVAANAAARFVTTLQTPARVAAFANQGIDVFTDKSKTQFKAPEEIIVQALKKTGGNQLKMNEMFKNIMGERAVAGFATRYIEGEKKDGAGGGEAAVRKRFAELYKAASMTELEVKTAAAERMQENDAKFNTAMEKLRIMFADSLMPAFAQMVPVIEELTPLFASVARESGPAFASLIKSLADFASAHHELIADIARHPIGAILAAEVTKSVASAGIGQLIAKLLGGGGGGGVGGAGLLAPVAAGAATYGLYKPAVDAALSGQTGGQRKAGELLAAIKNGSPADRDAAMGQIAAAQKRTSARGLAKDIFSASNLALNTATSLITGGKNESLEAIKGQFEARQIAAQSDAANTEATKANTAALKELAGALKPGGGQAPGATPPGTLRPDSPRANTQIAERGPQQP